MALDGAALREDARQEVLMRVLQAPIVDGFLRRAGHHAGSFSVPARPWCRSSCHTAPKVMKQSPQWLWQAAEVDVQIRVLAPVSQGNDTRQ